MDDSVEDSQATQQATQTALDPRRLGKQNSGFSDEDISDIVCLLYPNSENASREIQRIADAPEFSPHITGRYAADAIDSDLYKEDGARQFGRTRGLGDHAIVLKLSSTVKSPHLGFTFGRNQTRCDICFTHDPHRRLSNIHFRIYINKYGVVLLEDQSTNGTIVDDVLLKKKNAEDGTGAVRRTLDSGSTVKIFMHQNNDDLQFIVRVPRRDDHLEAKFQRNLHDYLRRLQSQDPDRTIIAPNTAPGGKLMPPPNQRRQQRSPINETTQLNTERFPREWRGGDKYSRVGVIGKGAFATVYKVTSKYNGLPYAAKELDKRKFMKNGILDQKVENEMKIMQRVHHPNIVQYIEHFDWDTHQFFIVMEYVPGGDLGKLVQENNAITEPYVKIIARQLIDAVGYLHDNKITHRDVKPDNILIESTSPELIVKLTDFGLSKMIDTEQTFLKTFCGTLLYCAPEVYSEYSTYDEHGRRVRRQDRKPINRERYDHAVDIWSLGGVLFYAITGAPPFPVKNGISYTELLHHIMTRPLDTRPLIQQNVSAEGIDFLQRMIDRRPETRATIAELKAHPWLHEAAGESFDEISDDGLEQGASQLSLHDGQHNIGFAEASALLEPLPDFSMEELEEDKENYTFEDNQAAAEQLWGEVNNSAFGSSGAVHESRLNLALSGVSAGETEIIGATEILDSFESDDLSTPRQHKASQPRAILSSDDSLSTGNSRSMALGAGSQSLGGAESILENLNMKSLARTETSLRIEGSDLNTSKRKPGYDNSDEFDRPNTALRPSFKRIKSREDDDSDEDVVTDELSLFASVPPIIRSESGRQMDYPLHKTTFWDSADRQTWHLDYPEMTHLQYAAFTEAVQKRKEDFNPGKSPLWDLAMRYFPPKRNKPLGSTIAPQETQRTLLRRDSRSLGRFRDWDAPQADPLALDDELASIPDTLPPDSQLLNATHETETRRKTVARFVSTPKSGPMPGSLISGICLSMEDPIMSWGRERDNTVVYQYPLESKVPKYAFRVLLWREGYTGSSNDFRPWGRSRSTGSATLRASPEPESFAFYISTKATNGLRINNNPLQPNEPKNSKAPSKYWMKLHHGDTIVFWGTDDIQNQAKLDFECYWGGSSTRRPADEPPTCVPDGIARKLDSTWARAEKSLHADRMRAEADADHEGRMRDISREQERSKMFEKRRAEAVRALALRANRQPSPLGPSPFGRNIPRYRQHSPAVRSNV